MKTKYKWIYFKEDLGGGFWFCRNSREDFEVGKVFYYICWKAWCFFPISQPQIGLSADYLRDIADFLEQLNKKGKDEKKG